MDCKFKDGTLCKAEVASVTPDPLANFAINYGTCDEAKCPMSAAVNTTTFTTKSGSATPYQASTWVDIYSSGALAKPTKITGIVITNSASPTTPIYRIIDGDSNKIFPYDTDNPVNSGALDELRFPVNLPAGASYKVQVNCDAADGNATLTELDVIEVG